MKPIRIGTRESQLAVWQSTQVAGLLAKHGIDAQLVPIKSEGDIDLQTPLYEMGVQGIFTRELDAAIISGRVDLAVHSLKDVPTQPAAGIRQAAVLKRGPVEDLLVFKDEESAARYHKQDLSNYTIATSSIRRKAQWLNRFPNHQIENLRGNVNTRLQKLVKENWNAAIFARAGLERIDLRPENSIILDWMVPAPAQGAIGIVCREDDEFCLEACSNIDDDETYLCTKIERDFLRTLLGGCTTPISALAEIKDNRIHFIGNILTVDGKQKVSVEAEAPLYEGNDLGARMAIRILQEGGREIADSIRHAAK